MEEEEEEGEEGEEEEEDEARETKNIPNIFFCLHNLLDVIKHFALVIKRHN